MKRILQNRQLRKLAAFGLALTLICSSCVMAFASTEPMGNMSMGNFGGPQNMQAPEAGGQNNMQAPRTMPSQDMNGDREDMTPPEIPETEPGENVPEKPESDPTEGVFEKPETEPDGNAPEKPENDPMTSPSAINMRAVESYIEDAGEDVDANVQNAYDALSEALAADPNEEENDISDLEAALSEALENAEIDLDEYSEAPDNAKAPEEMNKEDGGKPSEESSEDEDDSEFNQVLTKYWNKLVTFFKSLFK